MEKRLSVTTCKKSFKVSGIGGPSKPVTQRVTCPYCKEPNEVICPMDAGWEIIKGF